MATLTLTETVLLAERAFQVLSAKMADITRAHSTGNPARIGNAAHDVQMATAELDARLSDINTKADELETELWEADYATKFGRPFLSGSLGDVRKEVRS